jgi:hypothetical protein
MIIQIKDLQIHIPEEWKNRSLQSLSPLTCKPVAPLAPKFTNKKIKPRKPQLLNTPSQNIRRGVSNRVEDGHKPPAF